MKRNEEVVIIVGLILALAIVIYADGLTDEGLFRIMVVNIDDFLQMLEDDEFIRFAIGSLIGWELLPQTFQILGLGAVTTRLLSTGINPFILGIITALARLGGQIIMYFVGRFLAKFVFKNRRKEASAMHFLHKYHYIVYLFPAWLGAFGDVIMIVSGQQKINLLKIIPILYVGNLLDAYKWIFWDLGQIGVADSFE